MEDILVPLGVFAMVAAIVGFNVWGSAAKRRQVMETVRDAIRSGQTLDPATIKALGAQEKPKGGDLKSGLILIAVAAAFIVLGVAIGSADVGDAPEIVPIFTAIAAFPGFIGVVLVLFGLFNLRKSRDDAA
ncbi:MAG: DUF6249 domain-containing protein [Oceanicaulis sp.]